MKKNIKDLAQFDKINFIPHYELTFQTWYLDELDETFLVTETQDLFADELFVLILCYIGSKNSYKWFNAQYDYANYICGNHFSSDEFFPWLEEYLENNRVTCNLSLEKSIKSIGIRYFKSGEDVYNVILPEMKDIFDSPETMKEYINKLYSVK